MPPVYAISSYQSGHQLVRLVDTLRAMRPDVRVVVHHDEQRRPLDAGIRASLGDAAVRTSPFLIGWGDMSLERARWNVMRWILENEDADWIVHLSEQDYPLVPLAEFEARLKTTEANAILDGAPIEDMVSAGKFGREIVSRYTYRYSPLPLVRPRTAPAGRLIAGLDTLAEGTVNRLQRRYVLRTFPVQGQPARWGRRPRPALFGPDFACWFGSAWYAADRRAAEYLMDFVDSRPDVVDYFAHTVIPIEAATQTILGNAPDLVVERDALHHVRWSQPGSGRPDVFTADDLDGLLASGHPFARKVDLVHHPELLDALDAHLLGRNR